MMPTDTLDAGRRVAVLSGPSGSGKSTIARALARAPDVILSVSATTRAPRPGEVDGEDYHFLTREAFLNRAAAGEFVEYAEVYGNFYGTPRGPLEAALAAGRWALLDIDVQGAMQVRRAFPRATLIFIVPPSRDALARRLKGRASDTPEAIERRLAAADREMTYQDRYDHVVVNDALDEAVARVRAILDGAAGPETDQQRRESP